MSKAALFNCLKRLVPRKVRAWLRQTPYRRIERIRCKDLPGLDARRAEMYSKIMRNMGQAVYIKAGCIFKHTENIAVGSRVSFQYNCFISGRGGVKIGDDVSIGNGVEIISSDHPSGSGIMRTMPLKAKPVTIGNNVVIGTCAIILGASIGDNVMIGAGAVVTHDLPSNGVYAGCPAKLIKTIEQTGDQQA